MKLLLLFFLVSGSLLAADAGVNTLERLIQVRMKQEQEENVVRVIQPVALQMSDVCSPVQQARQRLENAGKKGEGEQIGDVKIEAGHKEVKIEGNSGTVNNSVNVEIVNPNDKRCL